jgi:hypothetical protein
MAPLRIICNVPFFALPYHDMSGKYGDLTAMAILYRIYNACIYIEEHLADLQKCLQKYNELVVYQRDVDKTREKAAIRLQETYQQRRILKKALREGELSSKEYEKQIKPIKEKIYMLTEMTKFKTGLLFNNAFYIFRGTPVFRVDRFGVINLIEALSKNMGINNT